jgi:hypothetical protein
MNRTDTTSARRQTATLRARIAAAFRKIARGVDSRTAQRHTWAFYRSSGNAWSRALG